MSFDRAVAHLVTHRRGRVWAVLAMLVALSAAFVVAFVRLDSEVLNLLPRSFQSVHALKIFNDDFTQAREVTFALFDPNHATDLDGFTQHFGDALRAEPWVSRVMDRSPMDSPEGAAEVQSIALPLLLNLEPAAFDAALAGLKPDALHARLQRLRGEIESGSPKAEMELNFDPLGLVTQALKPLAGSFSMEQTQPLASADGTLHLVLAVTNQAGLGPHECQAVMRQVDDFRTRVVASWHGPAPQILVTGRTAYVAEMSESMRHDIVTTLLGSILLVSAVFYIGFRCIRPLVAIMSVLLLCCIFGAVVGGLIFHQLNMITIGFCSILVGLGVDFGMLLYGSYQSFRNAGEEHETAIASSLRQLGRGVFFGAITTAAGFGSLVLSNCPAFAQLGVLIAAGILFAGGLMMTVFFAMLGTRHQPTPHDWLYRAVGSYVHLVFKKPMTILIATAALLFLLSVAAIAPIGRLHIEVNPKTLEPKDSQAGYALHTITAKMSAAGIEPMLVIVKAASQQNFYDQWARLSVHWTELVQRGVIKNFSSPAAFALSPERVQSNAAKVSALDIPAIRADLTKTLNDAGFSIDGFKSAFAVLDGLQVAARQPSSLLDWRQLLPENSSWWFVLDRFFGTEPNVGVAYVTPLKTISSETEKSVLHNELQTPGATIQPTGWSYVMADLVPWAQSKLIVLSVAMLLFNIVLLVFLYRSFQSLVILMLSLGLSIGAMITCLKIFAIPLNLFNVLAFPLVLGVGVDYGIYILVAVRQPGEREGVFATILKPVLLSGLTAVAGFGSLGLAHNPALSTLGIVCALGIAWCLFSTIFFILPAYVARGSR